MPEPAAWRRAPRRRAMNSGRLRLPAFMARRPSPFGQLMSLIPRGGKFRNVSEPEQNDSSFLT